MTQNTHLHREIHEQPDKVGSLIESQLEAARTVAKAIRKFKPQFVMIAARGTSDNAARYAQYLFGIQLGMPVALALPSVHTLYESAPRLGKALVIGISQSGASEDIRRVVADARAQGALTLAITNTSGSVLNQAAEHHIDLGAGPEVAVAATKTYTTELAAVALLAAAYQNKGLRELRRLPAWMTQTLKRNAGIADWAERYRYAQSLAVIGRGYNYCTAYEVSLKIKELCSMTSQEYSEADFRHGPIAVVQRNFPVLMVAPQGAPLPHLLDLMDKLHAKQAEVLAISNDPSALAKADKPMPLPTDLPEWLSPLCAVLPGQVLALHMARQKGLDVDKPDGLTKVTITQ
ncbi:MAG: SIS domain-containing protein [Anaerolineae bacterium]|jgi:glucosamine--fructose-6-phosphate aminotransferase (isomerizing)|nr:SIS domain-containing protein [Anaerolineae bacterium]